MLKRLICNGTKYGFLPLAGLFGNNLDDVTKTEQEADMSVMEKETGWDRLRLMYSLDDDGNITYEANSILQVGAMSMFVGFIFGGFIQSRNAYMEFMRNNVATKFRTHLEAKKELQHQVTMGFAKGGFRWGWRLTLFCTSFVGISTTIQAYKGKPGFVEYITAGVVTGALYKFNMGPRGWIVGGVIGSCLGLISGGATLALLSLSGISMEEARYWQYYWKRSRSEVYKKKMKEYIENESFAVIKLHDDKIGEAGKDLSNLDKNVNNNNKS